MLKCCLLAFVLFANPSQHLQADFRHKKPIRLLTHVCCALPLCVMLLGDLVLGRSEPLSQLALIKLLVRADGLSDVRHSEYNISPFCMKRGSRHYL